MEGLCVILVDGAISMTRNHTARLGVFFLTAVKASLLSGMPMAMSQNAQCFPDLPT